MEEKRLSFIFGIHSVDTPKGVDWKTQMVNQGIPHEIVITKLRMLLRGMEDEYFHNFARDFP